jgi:hypothetical protein
MAKTVMSPTHLGSNTGVRERVSSIEKVAGRVDRGPPGRPTAREGLLEGLNTVAAHAVKRDVAGSLGIALINDVDVPATWFESDGDWIRTIGTEGRVHNLGKVAGEIVDLESPDLVVLRTKNPDEGDRATAAPSCQTHCN